MTFMVGKDFGDYLDPRTRVGDLQPMEQIWPDAGFCRAHELKMFFTNKHLQFT